MKEHLNVLDENGKSKKMKKTRKEVHQRGYWHRTVQVWIMNDKRQ